MNNESVSSWRPDWRPDWHNQELYPDPTDEHISNERWAWEFLRRNERYAEDCGKDPLMLGTLAEPWDEFMEDNSDNAAALSDVQYALEATPGDFEKSEVLRRTYMVKFMYPPSTPPKGVLFRYDYVPDYTCFDSGGRFFNNDLNPKCKSWSEVLIKFDLGVKIEEQLEWAERKLKEMRDDFQQRNLIELQPSPEKEPRIRNARYQKLLRLLDGLYQGASLYEVGKVLFPSANSRDKRDLREEALALSQWKYKLLLYHSP